MKARIPGAQNQGNMMKRIQQMQEDMQNAQAEVENSEFTATAGGGAVEVTVSGSHEVRSIKMQPDIVDPDDIEMLQDLVLSAVNEALRKADDMVQEEMAKVAGIPAGSMPGNMFR